MNVYIIRIINNNGLFNFNHCFNFFDVRIVPGYEIDERDIQRISEERR